MGRDSPKESFMNERLLYYKSTCPYCQKVLNFIDEQGIELPLKNIDQNA